jgi:effector-binding domain-containing protein
MKQAWIAAIALFVSVPLLSARSEDAAQDNASPKLVVEVTEAKAQPVVQIRMKAKREEIAVKLGQAYGALMMHVAKVGGKQVMMPMSRYYGSDAETIDMAAVIAVAEPIQGEGEVQADTLPAGPVASTWHVGPYEKLTETYAALERWITDNGHEAGEQAWEIYWTDPGTESNPAKLRTQIFRQLKK